MSWGEHFDRLHPHLPLFREQAIVYVESLEKSVGLRAEDRVLDFGCGLGHVAELVAPRVAEVRIWDSSSNLRRAALERTDVLGNVELCDPSTEAGAEQAPFDLILVNSVAQYMSNAELAGWLLRWRELLATEGRLVLSDLITPGQGLAFDVVDLLRFGFSHGARLRAARDALGGVLRYARTRRRSPLTHVGRDDLQRQAAEAGLSCNVLASNLTHFRRRWTAILQPREPSTATGRLT